MAQVDFSNAILTPYNANNYCPVRQTYLSMPPNSSTKIVNSSGTGITSTFNKNNIQ